MNFALEDKIKCLESRGYKVEKKDYEKEISYPGNYTKFETYMYYSVSYNGHDLDDYTGQPKVGSCIVDWIFEMEYKKLVASLFAKF